MAKGSPALAFATGLGEGWISDRERKRRQGIEDQDRADRKEERDLRMGEVKRQASERTALADAVRPATIEAGAGGQLRPDTMDNRDVGQPGEPGAEAGGLSSQAFRVGGKSFGDQASADAAVTAYNAPQARDARTADAYRASGNPEKAITLENANLSQGNARLAQGAARRKEADEVWRGKVGSAMQAGHDGLAELASQTEVGPLAGKKVKAVPSADGKMITYNVLGEDGSLTPTKLSFPNDQSGVVQAAYLMDRAITPEHRMENHRKEQDLTRKVAADEDKFRYQQGQLANAADKISLTGQLAEARIAAQQAKASNKPDGTSREERIRYTSLLSDAGRRMGEAQRALSTLQKDPMYSIAKPGSQQAQELSDLRESISAYKGERDLYSGLLAGSQTGDKGKPALADARVAPAPMPKVKNELKVGKVYNTARGPAKWNGTAFEAQ
ncbi:MAG: hypothetical protein ABIR26_07040 [Ramlibacter sp.]